MVNPSMFAVNCRHHHISAAIFVANVVDGVGDFLESCSAAISVALANLSSNAAILDSNFLVSLSN